MSMQGPGARIIITDKVSRHSTSRVRDQSNLQSFCENGDQTKTNTCSTPSIMYSPAPAFRSPSPSFSQSSLKYDDDSSEGELGYAPASAPDETAGSPGPSSTAPAAEQVVDTVTCLWDDCGIVFTHLPTLIEHIHSSESFPPYPYCTPMTCVS